MLNYLRMPATHDVCGGDALKLTWTEFFKFLAWRFIAFLAAADVVIVRNTSPSGSRVILGFRQKCNSADGWEGFHNGRIEGSMDKQDELRAAMALPGETTFLLIPGRCVGGGCYCDVVRPRGDDKKLFDLKSAVAFDLAGFSLHGTNRDKWLDREDFVQHKPLPGGHHLFAVKSFDHEFSEWPQDKNTKRYEEENITQNEITGYHGMGHLRVAAAIMREQEEQVQATPGEQQQEETEESQGRSQGMLADINSLSMLAKLEGLYTEFIPFLLGVLSLKAALNETREVLTKMLDETYTTTVPVLQHPTDFLMSSSVWTSIAFFIITYLVALLNASRLDLESAFRPWVYDKDARCGGHRPVSRAQHFWFQVRPQTMNVSEFLVPRLITNLAVVALKTQGCDPYGVQDIPACTGEEPNLSEKALQYGTSGFAMAYFAFSLNVVCWRITLLIEEDRGGPDFNTFKKVTAWHICKGAGIALCVCQLVVLFVVAQYRFCLIPGIVAAPLVIIVCIIIWVVIFVLKPHKLKVGIEQNTVSSSVSGTATLLYRLAKVFVSGLQKVGDLVISCRCANVSEVIFKLIATFKRANAKFLSFMSRNYLHLEMLIYALSLVFVIVYISTVSIDFDPWVSLRPNASKVEVVGD